MATRSAIEGIHAAEGLHRGRDDALAVLRSAYVTVNNAGIGNAATGLGETPEWDVVLRANLSGAF